MKRTIILLLAVAMIMSVLFLSSCKKSSNIGGGGNDNGNNPPAAGGLSVGDAAPNFTETDSQGNPFTLESLRGNVVVVSFSAMWCGPCRAEAPELASIYNTYKERGLEIVQCIYQDEGSEPADLDDLARWINEFGIPFTVINDPDRSTVDAYKFRSIPFNVILDRELIIRDIITGNYPTRIIQAIEDLL